jgi:hypothetical protein
VVSLIGRIHIMSYVCWIPNEFHLKDSISDASLPIKTFEGSIPSTVLSLSNRISSSSWALHSIKFSASVYPLNIGLAILRVFERDNPFQKPSRVTNSKLTYHGADRCLPRYPVINIKSEHDDDDDDDVIPSRRSWYRTRYPTRSHDYFTWNPKSSFPNILV